MNATAEPPAQEITFEIVPANAGIAPESKHRLELAFSDIFAQAHRWKEQAAGITSPKLARAARLEIKKLRVAGEKKHEEMKADYLREGRAVDGAKNILLALLVPIEKQLEGIEKEEERRIAAENEARGQSRAELLAPLGVTLYTVAALGVMREGDFSTLLEDAKALHEARLERERKAEAERVAKELAEAQERERIRVENERLKKEATEREEAARIEREKAEAERKALEAKMAAEREEAERKAAAEAKRVQAEKDAAAKAAREVLLKAQAAAEAVRREAEEKASRERAALEAVAAKEREAREKVESEARAREAAELKAKEIAAKAAKKAAAAPDKKKLEAFAESIRTTVTPEMASEQGKAAMAEINEAVTQMADWILGLAGKL